MGENNKHDYSKEPVNDYFLIDMKSFYSSVECVERNLYPLTAELIVMSWAENTGSGFTLAACRSKIGQRTDDDWINYRGI